MPRFVSSNTGKVKKSKLEKIHELQAELKVIKEENSRLQKALIAVRNDGNGDTSHHSSSSEETSQIKKMKQAFVALKNVTVSQEKTIHSMKQRATERRKQVQKRDAEIATLYKQIETLQGLQEGLTKAKGGEDIRKEFLDLQEAFFDEQTITAKLEAELAEKEKIIDGLQSVLKAQKLLVSNQSETNYLKAQLQQKTSALDSLQDQVEELTEELLEIKSTSIGGPSTHGNLSSIGDDDYFDDDDESNSFNEGSNAHDEDYESKPLAATDDESSSARKSDPSPNVAYLD